MSAQSRLPQLWQLYGRNEDRCTALYLRLRERATDTRQYEHSHNPDAETLRVRSLGNHDNAIYDSVLAGLRLRRAVGDL